MACLTISLLLYSAGHLAVMRTNNEAVMQEGWVPIVLVMTDVMEVSMMSSAAWCWGGGRKEESGTLC